MRNAVLSDAVLTAGIVKVDNSVAALRLHASKTQTFPSMSRMSVQMVAQPQLIEIIPVEFARQRSIVTNGRGIWGAAAKN